MTRRIFTLAFLCSSWCMVSLVLTFHFVVAHREAVQSYSYSSPSWQERAQKTTPQFVMLYYFYGGPLWVNASLGIVFTLWQVLLRRTPHSLIEHVVRTQMFVLFATTTSYVILEHVVDNNETARDIVSTPINILRAYLHIVVDSSQSFDNDDKLEMHVNLRWLGLFGTTPFACMAIVGHPMLFYSTKRKINSGACSCGYPLDCHMNRCPECSKLRPSSA